MDIRTYILAGGGSTRFGQDKALAMVGGKTMLARMRDLLRDVAAPVSVVAPGRKYDKEALGVQMVEDCWPGEGPLGGIITALRETEVNSPQCAWNVIVSCDMPFLTPAWIQYLGERAKNSAAQAVIPRTSRGLEPLCACWQTAAVTPLQRAFGSGTRKVAAALENLRTEVLDEADWKRFDSSGHLFRNMNTAVDFAEVAEICKAEKL